MARRRKFIAPRIRLMTEDDIDQVIDLDRSITGKNRSITFSDPVTDYLGGDMAISYVADAGDKIVGFIMGSLTDIGPRVPNVGLVELVGVEPVWRKKGIGKKLVEAFVKTCKEKKANAVHMLLMAQDEPMRALFESCSFTTGDTLDMERKL